jgi:hypothetical protein
LIPEGIKILIVQIVRQAAGLSRSELAISRLGGPQVRPWFAMLVGKIRKEQGLLARAGTEAMHSAERVTIVDIAGSHEGVLPKEGHAGLGRLWKAAHAE